MAFNVSSAVVFSANNASDDNPNEVSFAAEGSSMMTRLLGARSAITTLITQRHIDIVASHFSLYSIPALDKIRKKPFVVHFHGPWAAESLAEGSASHAAFIKLQLEKLVYRQADRLIVLSDAFATLLHQDYGVRKDLIRVIPGSVDTDRFNTHLSKAQARVRPRLATG